MERINEFELERRIVYLQYVLEKLERRMLKEQSERLDMKQRLSYLHFLQKQMEEQLKLAKGTIEIEI
jgi:hypothetical protein